MDNEDEVGHSNLEESPLDAAIRLLKGGDLKAARLKLEISEATVSDEDFVSGLMSIDRGIEFFKKGDFQQAVEPLSAGIPVIKASSDIQSQQEIALAAAFSQGVNRLWTGDPHGAFPLLNLSKDIIESLGFFAPGFEKYALSIKATTYLALAQAALSRADIAEAKSYYGHVNQIHEELLFKLDEKDKDDIPGFAEIYGTRVEIAGIFLGISLSNLDFEAAEQQLLSVEDDYDKLVSLIPYHPNSSTRAMIEVIATQFYVYRIFYRIVRRIIIDSALLSQHEIEELNEVRTRLFNARKHAHDAVGRGKRHLYIIEQLDVMREQLIKINAERTERRRKKPKLFISHSTKDRHFVKDELQGLLHALGFETWFAEEDIKSAEQWERAILKGLESSAWFVLVMSQASSESKWVRAEVSWAIEKRQDRIVPILKDECNVRDIHMMLPQIQHVDYLNNPKKARERLIELLVEAEYRLQM